MRRQIRATLEFASHLFARVREDRLAQVSGGLTFTTLLALVPLLTVTLTVFSAFPVVAGFAGAIRSFILENLVPAASGRVITVYMQQFAENAGGVTYRASPTYCVGRCGCATRVTCGAGQAQRVFQASVTLAA